MSVVNILLTVKLQPYHFKPVKHLLPLYLTALVGLSVPAW